MSLFEDFGHLGDPEAVSGENMVSLAKWRKMVDAAEGRRDAALEVWKSDPTTQNRVYYDVAMKSWASMYNRYHDKLREALGE